MLTNFLFFILGVFVGFLFTRLRAKYAPLVDESRLLNLEKEKIGLEERCKFYEKDNIRLQEALVCEKEERLSALEQERKRVNAERLQEKEQWAMELREEREKANTATIRLTKSIEAFKAQEERLKDQKNELDQLHQKLTIQFENIAGKILEEKTQKFTDVNRVNMDLIINPLKEKIIAFEQKVEKTYDKELRDKISLREEVRKLYELNARVSQEANNLAKALKGDAKKQGNWGEMILERVLERSGLIKDQEYTIQQSFVSEEGIRMQPDVVINLPDNKHLIVDAKVSLLAYERYVNALDEEKEIYLKQHLSSIRQHVSGLSGKNYQDLYGIHSPDFVLLFLPIESSFSVAVQDDHELFNYAWDRKVVIVSPSTLLATLYTVASIWKQDRQNKNVLEIARLSGQMYNKFVGFVGDMEGIDKNLRSAEDAFNKAMNKLTSGHGNLTATANKIVSLGAKAGKQLHAKYIEEKVSDEGDE